ncbi:MarR family winged helix-turn-helix transcriptional regulator [Aurantimonas sp. A3-2-R12]|uniref:MarR family winged helix-turn-helix transcriptional regulator n=1 Tax=Aurantimonas sp. A3-2-R12 TaxID=3114362 RepID=UPI002E17C7C0|nr:MarR family winged helix-turn-helix transcriptional regulator [Aurantimonas sp. A3-2-R12]
MDSRVIAELVVHLGRIASGDGLVEGLTPGQWAVLRYFARANRFSRTPSAFAAFHGTTRGTASQAIKSLVAQGYLLQTRSDTDGRSVRLDLADKARAMLAKDPLEALARAADALPPGVRGQFSNGIQRMLGHLASETGKPPFGTCENCAHFEGDGCCQEGLAPYACGFLKEPLIEEELDELCINFATGKAVPPRPPGVGAV